MEHTPGPWQIDGRCFQTGCAPIIKTNEREIAANMDPIEYIKTDLSELQEWFDKNHPDVYLKIGERKKEKSGNERRDQFERDEI